MEFDTTAFQYAPLPTATSIRLVRIQRGRDAVLPTLCGHPLIRLSMQTIDLAAPSVPSYKSLSYTWDSPEPEWQKRQLDLSAPAYGYGTGDAWPAAVNGKLLLVRKNLFEALAQLAARYSRVADEGDARDFGKTALHVEAEDGRYEWALDLIRKGASVGARDAFGETPLHYAAQNGHLGIVRELVRAGADVSLYDARGRTPLHCAVHRKRGPWREVVRFLQDPEVRREALAKGAHSDDLEERYEFSKTALHVAAEWGRVDEVRELLRKGADTEARDVFAETPLHYAAENGEYKIVKLLVRAGADIKAVDNRGRVPRDNALEKERNYYREVAEFLQDEEIRERVLAAEDWEEDEDSPELFWVDAICINQSDLQERSAQVMLMPQIYGKADSVLVWLGSFKPMVERSGGEYDEFKALTAAIKRMNAEAANVGGLARKWRTSLCSFIRKDSTMPKDGIFSPREITQITYWLTRSWFTRSWVVQELALAKDIRMFAAEFEFPWSDVLKFLCLMFYAGYFDTAKFWRIDEGTRTKDGAGGDGSEAWKLAVIRLRTADNPKEWTLLDPIFSQASPAEVRVRRHDKLSLALLLAETWNFGAKDPRDKIFALMSMAATLPESQRICVDYTIPISDLYTQAAYIFLEGSGTSSIYITDAGPAGILEPLEGLSYVQDPYVGAEGSNPDLPTWVPDFSMPLITSRIWSRRFSAASSIEPLLCPFPAEFALQVHTADIDEVAELERDWDELDYLETDIHKLLFFACRALTAYNEKETHDAFFVALLRTLVADEIWDPQNEEIQAQAISSFRHFLCAELKWHQPCLWGGHNACMGAYNPEKDPKSRKLRVDPTTSNLLEDFSDALESPEMFTDLRMALKALRTRDSERFLPTDEEIKSFKLSRWCNLHGPDCTSETEDHKDFRSTMAKYYRKRGLFRTAKGRIGLGPQSLQARDRLVLIAGARTPFAVTETKDEETGETMTEFIGEVYLHGAMDGELLTSGDLTFETTNLV